MKAIILPLFTATLLVVCSAFPLDEKMARVQQSTTYCATLTYNQDNTTGYVHLCHTPGEGITHTCYLICMHARVYIAGLVYPRYCPFSSTTIAGTCITANLPRCRPSTMQSATPVNVTLPNGMHQVLFSATSCTPGKL